MATLPFQPSTLDGNQVLQAAFDEANGRLRVETAATIVDGAVEVAIDASTDNIAIKDPASGNILKINSDGSINTSGGGGGSTDVNIHDSSGNTLSSTSGALNVNTSGTSTVTGTVTTNEAGLDNFNSVQYTIGTSVVQIASPALSGRSSINLKCGRDNAGTIYFKNNNTVSPTNASFLYGGDSITLDLSDLGNIFVIADQSGQILGVIEMA